jgi:hypothetical protein
MQFSIKETSTISLPVKWEVCVRRAHFSLCV